MRVIRSKLNKNESPIEIKKNKHIFLIQANPLDPIGPLCGSLKDLSFFSSVITPKAESYRRLTWIFIFLGITPNEPGDISNTPHSVSIYSPPTEGWISISPSTLWKTNYF